MNTYIYNIFIFNFKTNIMKKIKAFTLLEILFICILLWAWLVSIFQAANRAKIINERITQTIIANQIATEGVEILYQFRNSNFLKHQQWDLNGQYEWTNFSHWNWNKCRLALNYESGSNCSDRLWTWYYYIRTRSWINTIAECNNETCNNSWWDHISTGNLSAVNIIDNKYAICLKSWVWTPCPEWHEAWWDQSKYWKFYRAIRGIWLYNMATNDTWWILLQNTTSENIALIDAQEYRFCSMVARKGWENWRIEICSTMTNFIE